MEYEKLNEAAQTLYDAAFAQGKMKGRDEAAHECVEHVGRRMIELAAQNVELALGVEDESVQVELVKIAGRIYGRTPGGPGFAGGKLPWMFEAAGGRGGESKFDEAEARLLMAELRGVAAGES